MSDDLDAFEQRVRGDSAYEVMLRRYSQRERDDIIGILRLAFLDGMQHQVQEQIAELDALQGRRARMAAGAGNV